MLRTRSPLSTTLRHLNDATPFPVRLACVKHAASVHPEPGSNSPYRQPPAPTPYRTDSQLLPYAKLFLLLSSLPKARTLRSHAAHPPQKLPLRLAGLAYLVTLQLLRCRIHPTLSLPLHPRKFSPVAIRCFSSLLTKLRRFLQLITTRPLLSNSHTTRSAPIPTPFPFAGKNDPTNPPAAPLPRQRNPGTARRIPTPARILLSESPPRSYQLISLFRRGFAESLSARLHLR